MRLAWLVYGRLSQPTGGYIYDRLVVDGLRAAGDRVDVVDLEPSSDRASDGRRMDVGRFDALVGDGLCAPEVGPVFEHAAGGPARVLLVHHWASWERERADGSALRGIEARAVLASDAILVTGHATARRLSSEYPGRAIDVVIPGCDRLPLKPPAARSDGALRVLFVGSVIPRKRLPMLLAAVERIDDPRLRLTVVGDAERDPAHAREIAALLAASPRLARSTRMVGVLGDEALSAEIAGADVLVLPSSLEGFGMILVEALRAGLPVVSARQALCAAGVADTDAAIAFDDLDGLVEALGSLLADPARLPAMRAAADRLPRATWEETVNGVRAMLARERARAPHRALSRR